MEALGGSHMTRCSVGIDQGVGYARPFSAYISSQADSPATPCAICSEVDDITEDCALSSMAPATKKAPFPPAARSLVRGGPSRTKLLGGRSGAAKRFAPSATTWRLCML